MKIFSVNHVTVTVIGDNPLALSVAAMGLTSTLGWRNPRLETGGDSNPQDHIAEMTFEADPPGSFVPQVLTPVTATEQITSESPVDAVIVIARSNAITVHASQFITAQKPASQMALGPRTVHQGEEVLALNPVGQFAATSGQFATTYRLGEEIPPSPWWGEHLPTSYPHGEELPPTNHWGEHPTTYRLGEEIPTTMALGEEGPGTDPRLDDPTGPTTQMIGEEMTGHGGMGGASPFGSY